MTDLGLLASLGTQLRGAGVTPRALAAWAGTARLSALPARLEMMSDPPQTRIGALLTLLISGREVVAGQLAPSQPRLANPAAVADELVDLLIRSGLVEQTGNRLRARLAVLPLGELGLPGQAVSMARRSGQHGASLLVCDRLDAAVERELVCWPDDSSYHLAQAIPAGRRGSWLDLGCGSAFAPLMRPELASRIVGVDINERAVGHARLGAALSGIGHLTMVRGDIGAAHDPAELVTCNAPMPPMPTTGDREQQGSLSPAASWLPEVWRQADPGLFERLWPAVERSVLPGGMAVVHAACEAMLPALEAARGERVIVRYTPAGVRGFAVAWWRPDAPDRLVTAQRMLTADRPHIDARDREDALAA